MVEVVEVLQVRTVEPEVAVEVVLLRVVYTMLMICLQL